MSTQVGSLGLYNQYNPYSSGLMSDDFYAQQMYQSYNETNGEGQKSKQTSFQGHQQPQTDTFEKSGHSGLSTGLKLGLVGGAGTGIGMYFFGSDPVKDGKFNDDILNAIDINVEDTAKQKFQAKFRQTQNEIFSKYNIPTDKGINIENLKSYLDTSSGVSDLSSVDKGDIQKAYDELTKIDVENIQKEAYAEAIDSTLQGQKNKLAKLQSCKSKLESLADDADLEKFFQENAETFGITGDENAITTKAQELAKRYKNKAGALTDYTDKITNQEKLVNATREGLNSRVATYYDDAAKSLRASAPDNVQRAFKNFKWKTAGKWGAIAAAVGLVLGWMFGGSSNK